MMAMYAPTAMLTAITIKVRLITVERVGQATFLSSAQASER